MTKISGSHIAFNSALSLPFAGTQSGDEEAIWAGPEVGQVEEGIAAREF
ncbi:hypothetical protein [Pseudomonas aeruginosa]|nr:hypothetical protein [Pseudomonas aeruginosa]